MIRRRRAAPLLLLLFACAEPLPADLTIAHDMEPRTLDPAIMTGVAEGRIAFALFEGLTRLDPETLEPVPGVATHWEVSDDGLRWTFHLRDDAVWSDGTPLTAEDFRWSWRRVLEPKTAAAYASLLFDIEGAREVQAGGGGEVGLACPDPATLVVRLIRPVPYFPSLAAFWTTLPVPRHAVEAHGDRWTRAGHLVGNGPFTLEAWAFYREILLRKNPRYRDSARVATERIRLLPVIDPNTQVNLYETGGVDLVFTVPPSILHRLKDRPDFRHGPRLATAFLRLNVTRPPFDDPRVRRAFAMAIDREALVRDVTRGGEVATLSLVPPGLPGYAPRPGHRFDPEAARKLLAEAGYPGGRGLPEVALLSGQRPDHARICAVLQHQLATHLGAVVHLDIREWKVYIQAMKQLDHDLAYGQWIGDYPDPSTFLDCFRPGSGNNRTGWNNAAYEQLLASATGRRPGDAAADAESRRMTDFGRAETLLLREAPIVPLYHPTVKYMVSPDVRGFTPNLLGLVHFGELSVRRADDR